MARVALGMLEDGGACVHVHATTHQGVETDARLPHPRPPRSEIEELVERFLGPIRRAGSSSPWANREEEVWRAAGFDGPQRIEVPGKVVERTSDQIVAGIFSLSSSTPHLFGERREAFESDLRRLLHDVNPSGIFSEQMREIAADIWRPKRGKPAGPCVLAPVCDAARTPPSITFPTRVRAPNARTIVARMIGHRYAWLPADS